MDADESDTEADPQEGEAEASGDEAGPAGDEAEAPESARSRYVAQDPRFRGQQVLAGFLLALGLLFLLAGTITVWVETTVLNTDEFVDTVGPLIEDEEVTDALSRTLVAQIFADVSTEEVLSEELPNLPGFVAPLLDTALEEVTLRLTQELLQTQIVADIWQGAVRTAHETASAIISGDTALQNDEGDVVLDLTPVIENLTEPLQNLGLDLGLDDAVADSDLGKIVLIEDGQLGTVQDAVELLDTLSWFLPALAVLLLALAIYVSRRRRTSTMYTAVGVFVMMIVLGLVLRLSKSFLLDNVKEENRGAAEDIWDHVLRRLVGSMLGLAALAVVAFVVLWFTGRSSSAESARGRISDGLDRLRGGRLGELTPEGLDEKIAPRRRGIQIGAVLVTVVIVWAQPTLSGTMVVVAAVLLGFFLLAVEFLVRPPRDKEESEPAEPVDESDESDESDDDDSEAATSELANDS